MKKPFRRPEPGDKVKLKINGEFKDGILLESYDKGIVLVKLENGYNIGFKKEDISEIKILEKKKDKRDEIELKKSNNKPIIDIILTGGTISSKLDPSTGGVKGLINSKELFSVFPEIFDIADIRVHSPFIKLSENMIPSDWIKIAKLVGKSLNDDKVKGVIVSHGTDTLHYTASALSFMLGKINKPVVLTYSQRSSDRGSSDGRMNLICSSHTALSDIAEVVIVGHGTINDNYCYIIQGNKCRKMHSSRRDTFRPINCKPYGKVFTNGNIEMIRNDFRKRDKEKVKVDAVFDNKVGILKSFPGINPKILDYYLKNFKGIVIEGTGFGHVITEGRNNWISKLKEVMKKGLLVYMSTQTIYGRANPYVYSSGRKLESIGVVYLDDILPETAFVKLGWVLGHKSWRGSVATKKKMLENINGEFNYRLGFEFLV